MARASRAGRVSTSPDILWAVKRCNRFYDLLRPRGRPVVGGVRIFT